MEKSTPLKQTLFDYFIPMAMDMERKKLEGETPTLWERGMRFLGELLVYGPLKDHFGLNRIRHAYNGGEALGEDTFVFFRALGINLKQLYGSTETCAFISGQSDGEVRLHTVGKPYPGVEVKIGEDGEVLVQADNVLDEYYNQPEATREAFEDGWFRTGDAGYLEEDGHLVILGRVSEVRYTARGERYVPNYIENRLKFNQYIRDAAVIGEDREYLVALICIDREAVGHWAEVNGVAYTSYADLSQKPEVYDRVHEAIQRVNDVLEEGLNIRRFVNLHKAFDPDDGEITRTRKLRRNVIEDRYARIIEALYGDEDEITFQAQITYESGDVGSIERTLRLRDVRS